MVNFTCNRIICKDLVSIFYVAKRSIQEPVLEIKLKDELKTTITNKPIEESDAIVPIAQFIKQDPITPKTLEEALDILHSKQ